jgi:hypothetical protein
VLNADTANLSAEVYVFGYLIPAGAAATGAADPRVATGPVNARTQQH